METFILKFSINNIESVISICSDLEQEVNI